MQSLKQFTGLFAAALVLGACEGGSTPQTGSQEVEASSQVSSQTSSQVLPETSSEAIVSSEASSSSSAVESESTEAISESVVVEEAPSQSDSSAASDVDPGGSTQLNEQEAALIGRATAKIEELTGYPEGEQYLYIIEDVQGTLVNLSIRENGEQAASAVGFYRYDDETGQVQEMDITTGEYVDFPATP